MATEVFTTEEIRLLDDTEVELRPLPIAKLRKFMRTWQEHIAGVQKKLTAVKDSDNEDGDPDFSEMDLTDEQYTVFIKLCSFGLEKELKGEMSDKQFTAYLEEVLDERTIYKILYVTGGLNLGDSAPNPQTLPGAAEAGTN